LICRHTPRADRDELRDFWIEADKSLSSNVSEADTEENDSPLAALLATLVLNPSRTKDGLDEYGELLSSKIWV
jgi:hypothetical protein